MWYNQKTPAQIKRARYGLTTFERKLLNDWLQALGIDNSELSIEQRKKYITYPGFQFLLQKYRHDKPRRKWLSILRIIPLRMRIVIAIIAVWVLLSYLVDYVR